MINDSFAMSLTVYPAVHFFSIFYMLRVLRKPYLPDETAVIDTAVLGRFGLSARETEIAGMLLEGLSYKAIGEKLFISAETVKSHAGGIYRKAGAASRQELARLIQRG